MHVYKRLTAHEHCALMHICQHLVQQGVADATALHISHLLGCIKSEHQTFSGASTSHFLRKDEG